MLNRSVDGSGGIVAASESYHSINLSRVHEVDDIVVASLSSQIRYLTSIDLSGCRLITDLVCRQCLAVVDVDVDARYETHCAIWWWWWWWCVNRVSHVWPKITRNC
jgi:hypothetical protein